MISIAEVVELAKKNTGADNATAAAIGAPRQTVGKWRKGENGPGRKYFLKLCRVAGVDPAQVETDPMQPTPSQQQQGQHTPRFVYIMRIVEVRPKRGSPGFCASNGRFL